MSEKQAEVEIEVENDDDEDNEEQTETKPAKKDNQQQQRINITKKKTKELTEAEKKQILEDARNGVENEFFQVKATKTGKPRIVVRRTTLSQQLLNEANETQPIQLPRRYMTDNQLLLEHVINLETSFNKLRSKHKKLKKRYNELEGYLYNDNDDNDNDKNDSQPNQELSQEEVRQLYVKQQQQAQQQQQQTQQQPLEQPQQQQYVQRRYVKSWRELGNQ